MPYKAAAILDAAVVLAEYIEQLCSKRKKWNKTEIVKDCVFFNIMKNVEQIVQWTDIPNGIQSMKEVINRNKSIRVEMEYISLVVVVLFQDF